MAANLSFSFSYPDVFLTGFVKRKTPQSLEITAFLVRLSGFEPLAFRLGGGRSILLSYRRML